MTPRASLTGKTWRTAAGLSVASILVLTVLVAPPATAATTPITPAPTAAATVPPPCGPLAVHRPIPLPASRTAAGPVLRRLAAQLGAEAADAQRGRYTRIRADITAADSSIGDCVSTVTTHVWEERVRDELTNSGRITGTPWYADPTQPPTVITTWYRAGELTGVLPGRVPADPRRLAAALDEAFPPDTDELTVRVHAALTRAGLRTLAGTERRVDAVGELAAWHRTTRAARQAILTVLADVPGLVYHGRVTVAGWTGIAVSIAARQNTSRYVLVLDEATGQIRAHEEVLTDPVIGRNLGVAVPYSFSRTLLARQSLTTTATVGQHVPRPAAAG